MNQVEIKIAGMHCQGCVSGVKQALGAVPGVQSVAVSYDQATAQVRFDAALVQPAKVESAINSTGYRVSNPTR